MSHIKSLIFTRIQAFMPLIIMGLRGTTLVVKFLLTLFIARFMGFSDVGVYGLIASLAIIVPIFSGLGITYILTRRAVTQTPEEITEALFYYGRFISCVYLLLLAVAIIGGVLLNQLFFVLIILSILFLMHVNGDLYMLFLNLSRPFVANLLHFIFNAVWMSVFMVLAYLNPAFRTMEVLLISWVIGGGLALLGCVWLMKDWPWSSAKELGSLKDWVLEEFSEAKTMYFTGLTTTTAQYFNHFLILFLLGLELTGVYVFFMQVVGALSNLLRTGVIQVTRPHLVRAYKENDAMYIPLYKKCLKHTGLSALALALFSCPAMYVVILYLDRPLALEWFSVLLLLLVVFVLTMVIEVNRLIFYAQHRDDIILKLGIIGVIGTILLNVVLVPWLALWGAAVVPLAMCGVAIVLQSKEIKRLI